MRNTYAALVVLGGLALAMTLTLRVFSAEVVLSPSPPQTEPAPAVVPAPAVGTVTIRKPAGPPTAVVRNPDTGKTEAVACVTCHAGRTPNPANAGTKDLDLFHQGLQVQHGGNTCLSCHDARDYGRLHLADSRPVPFTEVVTLCGQCHGPQLRDYLKGAHGGMNGAWDLTRGNRVRQACTACHDPHTPKYQGAHPVLPPRDRFLETSHD